MGAETESLVECDEDVPNVSVLAGGGAKFLKNP